MAAMNPEIELLRQRVLLWAEDYRGVGPGGAADFQEALDKLLYPYLWRLLKQNIISTQELSDFGGWCQHLWADLHLEEQGNGNPDSD